jgi:hypothetical protein
MGTWCWQGQGRGGGKRGSTISLNVFSTICGIKRSRRIEDVSKQGLVLISISQILKFLSIRKSNPNIYKYFIKHIKPYLKAVLFSFRVYLSINRFDSNGCLFLHLFCDAFIDLVFLPWHGLFQILLKLIEAYLVSIFKSAIILTMFLNCIIC